ncbi:C4-dicarboxylate transporter/malic acid transport protein [Patellaria atrata CBS 101060]|uniref:C4-dicarboxylate transporter/malic acid transport protein n=1 Tax=Patellaria atrata CBS 101060 TaxID=1346257 RepID=A0A9P4VTB2_9PEZI|nr:C4-dicarboxylate transporter/malic acid transport protein [Patellaria atrata CBS 101060]
MSSGGLALLLHRTPHRFSGLTTVGTILYILNLAMFLLIVAGLVQRFIRDPSAFKKSLKRHGEGLFFPCFWLSVATILANIQTYGIPSSGPWLIVTVRVCFWTYAACSILNAFGQYYILFTGEHLTPQHMTPSWILPVFPAMLTGTLASIIASDQPIDRRLPILVCGLAYQGLGWLVSLLMYPIYINRLMSAGLPDINTRPGMFIAVGPPSFTALALMGMSSSLPQGYGYFAEHTSAIETLQVMALFSGIFLWAFAFWMFAIAVISCLADARKMSFHLT